VSSTDPKTGKTVGHWAQTGKGGTWQFHSHAATSDRYNRKEVTTIDPKTGVQTKQVSFEKVADDAGTPAAAPDPVPIIRAIRTEHPDWNQEKVLAELNKRLPK
jgi:hypothetical protein